MHLRRGHVARVPPKGRAISSCPDLHIMRRAVVALVLAAALAVHAPTARMALAALGLLWEMVFHHARLRSPSFWRDQGLPVGLVSAV